MPEPVLAFDVGGTRSRVAEVRADGSVHGVEEVPTVRSRDGFLDYLRAELRARPHSAVGIAIAGTVNADHDGTLVCTHLPVLSHLELTDELQNATEAPVVLDNDARCALIAEAWLGVARGEESAVLLTLGTGVGGATFQHGRVQPHPADVSRELSRLIIDATDTLDWPTGRGSLEAFLGGKALEARFGEPLGPLLADVRRGDAEALAAWQFVRGRFAEAMLALEATYSPKKVIIGGRGAADLELYGPEGHPFPIVVASFGDQAGLVGAGRIALDALEEAASTEW